MGVLADYLMLFLKSSFAILDNLFNLFYEFIIIWFKESLVSIVYDLGMLICGSAIPKSYELFFLIELVRFWKLE